MIETEVVNRVEMRTPLESLEGKVKYLIEAVDILKGSIAILKRKVAIIEHNQEDEIYDAWEKA